MGARGEMGQPSITIPATFKDKGFLERLRLQTPAKEERLRELIQFTKAAAHSVWILTIYAYLVGFADRILLEVWGNSRRLCDTIFLNVQLATYSRVMDDQWDT